MKRSDIDKIISSAGLVVSIVLLIASAGLFYTHSFVHSQVYKQLDTEKIYFPATGSTALTSLPAADRSAVAKYAGQQLTTGTQAEVFADHYIAVHLREIGGGETYSQLSAASMADPGNQALAGQVQKVFQGETLRGLLLNAYAFDTVALVALYAAVAALIGGVILLFLAYLGFRHAGRTRGRK